MAITYAYGWRQPALPPRGLLHAAPPGGWSPEYNVDLRPHTPRTRNQSWLGACTGFALTQALSYALGRAGADSLLPSPQLADALFSPLWLYYRERETFGMTSEDTGAPLSVGLNILRAQGCPFEGLYPYVPERFAHRPPESVDRDARTVRVTNADALAPDEDTLLHAFAAGYPVVFGITTYRSFETAPRGRVPFPSNADTIRGGHALLALGAYRDPEDGGAYRVHFQNSWGDEWGEDGFGTIPMRYLTDPGLCGERLVIRACGFSLPESV